ncbi:hypothetical protein [Thermophagus xiamenensis]|uniref:Uncharacterized protein n=1 Tax=Thermophagus xiamenensis TaxID=385682 RepID=A0A1I1VWD4_9BACT|nr:hypothetical protein [Thermophagus xiamenensis]SFD87059.1 hypothetical protein SAMN05444380_10393 [Thermophagus xiamenensis]
MFVSIEEKKIAHRLVENFLKHSEKLPYVNIGKNNEYLGWVKDFNLRDSEGRKIFLDLAKEDDLFLLFVLVLGWSRTGPWENAVNLVSYLKINGKDKPSYWLEESNYLSEINLRQQSAELIYSQLQYEIEPRYKISFRKDTFRSIHVLATKWDAIINKLEISKLRSDYTIFMTYLRSVRGLGKLPNEKILKKIPLILRELRCQRIFKNIPGELCCVADRRVLGAAQSLGIQLVNPSNLSNLIECSTKIYKLMGDLYDLPLFAYKDLGLKMSGHLIR